MQAFGRKQMLSSAVLQGGGLWRVRNRKWTCLINRPDDLKSFPSRRKPCLNRRGYPMGLRV
jgi:hypothetical protein